MKKFRRSFRKLRFRRKRFISKRRFSFKKKVKNTLRQLTEKKVVTESYSATVLDPVGSTGHVSQAVFGTITQGTSKSNRLGNYIQTKNMNCTILFQLTAGNPGPAQYVLVRMILAKPRVSRALTVADFPGSVTASNNPMAYQTVKDWTFNIGDEDSVASGIKPIYRTEIKVPLKFNWKFITGGTTTQDDETKTLWLYWVTQYSQLGTAYLSNSFQVTTSTRISCVDI